ncbi:MAG: hypothetical protein AAFZ65_04785 [Planctomycetota bacterium]
MTDRRPTPEPTAADGLPPARARTLLAKLRDLDLHSARISIATGLDVSLDGCSTPDASAGRPLLYRLTSCRGDARLELRLEDGGLTIERRDEQGSSLGSRHVRLTGGPSGLVTAPEISARIDPEQAGEREVERFLRRVVRSAFAPA